MAKPDKRRDMMKCSYLTKAPPGEGFTLRKWRRRWFVLCDSAMVYPMAPRSVRLEYYENELSANSMGEPKGIVDLSECTAVRKSDRAVKGHKFVFMVVTDHREYYLSADSAAERNSWVEMLHAVTADDYKAREYREYLRQSKVYQSDPGPAASQGASAVATVGVSSATGYNGTQQPSDERKRPHSVGYASSPQLSTGQPIGEVPLDRSAGHEPRQVYAAVSRPMPENLGRLPQKRQQSAPALVLSDAKPPPIPLKRDESFLEVDEPEEEEEQLNAFSARCETHLTIEQNGVEIAALQPRRFGDGGSLESPVNELAEDMFSPQYQNQPDRNPSAGAYDHVVHQPSVRHKNRVQKQDNVLAYEQSGGGDYAEVPEFGGPDQNGGYSRVAHSNPSPAKPSPYEEITDFPAHASRSPDSRQKPTVKRVSSLDIKKRLGVNASPIMHPRSAMVDFADGGGGSSDEYDSLAPSPQSPPRPKPRSLGHSPRLSPSVSPSPTRGKPKLAPKPQIGLSASSDTHDHLTPPSSPMMDRRSISQPRLGSWQGPAVAPPGLASAHGPPPRLSPGAGCRRRVSSPCILADGNQSRFAMDDRILPQLPPKDPGMGGGGRGLDRRSVPDLHIHVEMADDIYDVPS